MPDAMTPAQLLTNTPVAAATATANATCDASAARVRSLHLSAEGVLRALREREAGDRRGSDA